MDVLIQIGILIICLLAIGAVLALAVAIFRLVLRSGIFKAGASNQEIYSNFFKAFFVQEALTKEGELSKRSSAWRAIISFLIMLGLGLVVLLVIAPQLGINS
jgi:hypothetical protein